MPHPESECRTGHPDKLSEVNGVCQLTLEINRNQHPLRLGKR